ncbi:sialin-like [Periplaneta americana]|uniref:sialin-like n=1 Tax=Periplaneta americana TaxID=6978 RepID=UPI0037E9B2A9
MEGCGKVRNVLWYLVFTGFAINYMFRLNLNIGIVSMVQNRQSKLINSSHSNECFQVLSTSTATGTNNTNITILTSRLRDESRFNWDEKQQGLVLGGFFWLHWICQVPGGMLAQKYGTKLVFGLSNVTPCLLSFLVPICARLDYRVLVVLRAFQGLIGGLSWPAMHHLVANWIPPNERSKFVTAYMGSSIGAAVTYPLFGLLISWFDWPSIFYVTGAFGILWFIAWWLLVYDSPALHPRISETEKTFILNSLGKTITNRKISTPWKKIVLSRPMWMNIVAQWGNIWGLFTLITQAPTYFRYIHGWDIRMTGLLSGIPHLCRTTFAIIMSTIGDYLLQKSIMSRTNVRKMATGVCCIGQGLFVLGLGLSGCNSTAAIICLTAATGVSGAVSTGPLPSFVDISPNFASIMLGISNMVSVIPGFVSPFIVGILTYQNQTVGQWQLVFYISTVMLVVPGVLYQFFSSAELQEWNSATEEEQDYDLKKMEPLMPIDTIVKQNKGVLQHEENHKTEIIKE